MKPARCSICENLEGNQAYAVREMMFGSREEFGYTHCNQCGCLFQTQIPADLSPYYPGNYYSFSKSNWLKTAIHRARVHRAFDSDTLLGKLAVSILGPDDAALAVGRLKLKKDARIVDIGCGNGMLVRNIRECGNKNTLGIDAYISETSHLETGGLIRKLNLFELNETYDAVLLNHSYEHMNDPLKVIRKLRSLLADEGRIVIRIPVVDSWAWRTYGVNWVNLDAPRHLFLHTKKRVLRSFPWDAGVGGAEA